MEYPLLVTAHNTPTLDNCTHCFYWNLNNIEKGDFSYTGMINTPLKNETTSLACFPDGSGFAIGSIEGRVGLKNALYDGLDRKIDDFNFKCHRES